MADRFAAFVVNINYRSRKRLGDATMRRRSSRNPISYNLEFEVDGPVAHGKKFFASRGHVTIVTILREVFIDSSRQRKLFSVGITYK